LPGEINHLQFLMHLIHGGDWGLHVGEGEGAHTVGSTDGDAEEEAEEAEEAEDAEDAEDAE